MLPAQPRFVGGTVSCRCQLNKNNALESLKSMKHISGNHTRGKKSFIEHQDAGEGLHIRGLSKEQIPVVVARDRRGNTCDAVLKAVVSSFFRTFLLPIMLVGCGPSVRWQGDCPVHAHVDVPVCKPRDSAFRLVLLFHAKVFSSSPLFA